MAIKYNPPYDCKTLYSQCNKNESTLIVIKYCLIILQKEAHIKNKKLRI